MVSIAEAIGLLREELAEAVAQSAQSSDQDVLLTVDSAQIELQVTLTTEVKGSAEVSFWVVKMGGQGGLTRGDSHKLLLTLTPHGQDGGPVRVSSTGRGALAQPPGPDR